MATELEEADLTADDLGYIAEAARIRAAMDRQAALAEKQRAEAAARADREAAQMEAAKLLQDGATPQEVTRLLGHRLYGGSPATFERAMRFAAPRPEPPPPIATNYHGQPYLLRQPGGLVPQRVPTPPAEKPSVMPPDVAAAQDIRKANAASLRRAMATGAKGARTPENTNTLKQLEAEIVRGATNYPGYKPPTPPTQPVAGKLVERVTKDGRRALFDATTKKFVRYAD